MDRFKHLITMDFFIFGQKGFTKLYVIPYDFKIQLTFDQYMQRMNNQCMGFFYFKKMLNKEI